LAAAPSCVETGAPKQGRFRVAEIMRCFTIVTSSFRPDQNGPLETIRQGIYEIVPPLDTFPPTDMSQTLELLDYRRQVAAQYAAVRAGGAGVATWQTWRDDRDRIFRNHPQSPIEDRARFTGLPYFEYDPAFRVDGAFIPTDDEEIAVSHSGEGSTGFRRSGRVEFEIDSTSLTLEVLWLDSYGGGVFLPFRDTTNGTSTYGGGRYLLDTVKGADLGHSDDSMALDFNYAYHPSCVHSYRWSCPLAPPSNKLDFAFTVGERLTH